MSTPVAWPTAPPSHHMAVVPRTVHAASALDHHHVHNVISDYRATAARTISQADVGRMPDARKHNFTAALRPPTQHSCHVPRSQLRRFSLESGIGSYPPDWPCRSSCQDPLRWVAPGPAVCPPRRGSETNPSPGGRSWASQGLSSGLIKPEVRTLPSSSIIPLLSPSPLGRLVAGLATT